MEPLASQPSPAATSTPSIWQHKPWWCQPWSILLTGFGLIAASWLALHRVWITALVALPLLAWMGFFLLVYPRLMQQMLAETPPQNFPET